MFQQGALPVYPKEMVAQFLTQVHSGNA